MIIGRTDVDWNLINTLRYRGIDFTLALFEKNTHLMYITPITIVHTIQYIDPF